MKPIYEIIMEVVLDKAPEIPDTPVEAELRAKLRAEVSAIREAGHDVDIPIETVEI